MYDDYDYDDAYLDSIDDELESYNDEIEGYDMDLDGLEDDEFIIQDSYDEQLDEID